MDYIYKNKTIQTERRFDGWVAYVFNADGKYERTIGDTNFVDTEEEVKQLAENSI